MVFLGRPVGVNAAGMMFPDMGPFSRMTAMPGVYEPCRDMTAYGLMPCTRGPLFARGPAFWRASGGAALAKAEDHVVVDDALKHHSDLFSELSEPTREMLSRGFLKAYGSHVYQDGELIDDRKFEAMISRYWHCLMSAPLSETSASTEDVYDGYSEMIFKPNVIESCVRDFIMFGACDLEDADDRIENALDEVVSIRSRYQEVGMEVPGHLSGKALNGIIVKVLRSDIGYRLFGTSRLKRIASEVAKSLKRVMRYEWEMRDALYIYPDGTIPMRLRTIILYLTDLYLANPKRESDLSSRESSVPPPAL